MKMIPLMNTQVFLFTLILLFLAAGRSDADPALEKNFHQLIMAKAEAETRFGIKRVECFPFAERIGFTKDQIKFMLNCLQGTKTLIAAAEALTKVDFQTAGISTRFLRTGGFHSILVPWDASKEEMIRFFGEETPVTEQEKFLNDVYRLKRTIRDKLNISELYCSQRISNQNCFQGYQSLAGVEADEALKRKNWREIVITDSSGPFKNPHALSLTYDASSSEMKDQLLNKDTNREWSRRKIMYETIETRFGGDFKSRLQLANFFCSLDLSEAECLQGAANLHAASENKTLQKKRWGKVRIHRYNTFITGDYDAYIRYDLTPEEIVNHLSMKPDGEEISANTNLAEKLETRAKNNSTGLRVVCDPEELHSSLCVQGFKQFFRFLEKHPDYRPEKTRESLMFVDGNQLNRVNFALNSKSAQYYIYLDANSGFEEVEAYLLRFRDLSGEDPAG